MIAPFRPKPDPEWQHDYELLQRFARSGSVSLCTLFHGLKPTWAWDSYLRLVADGLIVEDGDARVLLTTAGWITLEVGPC